MASSSAITLASWFTSRTGTGVPFPVDMDSMASVGAFTSEEEAQAERSGLPVQALGPLQRLTGLLQDHLDGGGEPLQKA